MRMSQKQIEEWGKTRLMGRQRFIWVRGVLGWGFLTGILWSLVMSANQGFTSFPIFLAKGIILFPTGGYFWSVWVWKSSEQQYLSKNLKDAS